MALRCSKDGPQRIHGNIIRRALNREGLGRCLTLVSRSAASEDGRLQPECRVRAAEMLRRKQISKIARAVALIDSDHGLRWTPLHRWRFGAGQGSSSRGATAPEDNGRRGTPAGHISVARFHMTRRGGGQRRLRTLETEVAGSSPA